MINRLPHRHAKKAPRRPVSIERQSIPAILLKAIARLCEEQQDGHRRPPAHTKGIAMTPAAVRNRAKLDVAVRKMYAVYQSGRTLEETATKFGRTKGSVYHLFKTRGLPRRHERPVGLGARVGQAIRTRLDGLVAQMYADYQSPMSLSAVARKYGRTRGGIRGLFETRHLSIRQVVREPLRDRCGRILPLVRLSDAAVENLIARATRPVIPPELRAEWRHWSEERRRWFFRRIRQKGDRVAGQQPTGPYSTNVEPFDYTSPHAQAIAARMNHGLSSRNARVRLRMFSSGVIWREILWTWLPKTGYAKVGQATGRYRPLLHRVIWEEANGKPVPPGHVVRFVDGNANNLVPENLALATRNDLARANYGAGNAKKSRALTAILLARAQSSDARRNSHLASFRSLSRWRTRQTV